MNLDLLSGIALLLAGMPTVLFLLNLRVYRRLPSLSAPDNELGTAAVSVLIPARNEASRIQGTLQSVLADPNPRLEVLVLDDHSTDETASLVQQVAAHDSRVRLVSGPRLPAGWCGKQHACHVLSRSATAPVLVFMDADVRLMPGALSRVARFLTASGAHLASGVPRQLLSSFSERLLIPLIHFVLLCYLPMRWARRSRRPAFAAGCGQLMVVTAAAYHQTGGHAAIRASLHDGLTLPRSFRRAGFKTETFDATDLAECRMYSKGSDVWPGLAKNATEGMAAPATLLPMSALLFGGHILPWLLLGFASLPPTTAGVVLAACVLSLLPRLVAAQRFGQPWSSALLHPLGVAALLGIQWFAFFRSLLGRPSTWKGREYPSRTTVSQPRAAVQPAKIAVLLLSLALVSQSVTMAAPSQAVPRQISSFILKDQFGQPHECRFPSTAVRVLTVADRKGSAGVLAWANHLKERYGSRVKIQGIADVTSVPTPLRGMLRERFRKEFQHPVMLDWQGTVVDSLSPRKNEANIYVIDRSGRILASVPGPPEPESRSHIFAAIDNALAPP